MRFPTAKSIDQFPCFLGESIYEVLGWQLRILLPPQSFRNTNCNCFYGKDYCQDSEATNKQSAVTYGDIWKVKIVDRVRNVSIQC